MPKINSRRAFLCGSVGGMLAIAGQGRAQLLVETSETEMSVFQAVVDTIIPADEQPGALALGLDVKLVSYAQQHSKWQVSLPGLVEQSNKLAQLTYATDFNLLALEQREKLLTQVLRGRASDNFFLNLKLVRDKLMRWYYISELGNLSLNYIPPAHYQLDFKKGGHEL